MWKSLHGPALGKPIIPGRKIDGELLFMGFDRHVKTLLRRPVRQFEKPNFWKIPA